jgi:hypothetical protein
MWRSAAAVFRTPKSDQQNRFSANENVWISLLAMSHSSSGHEA